jgi:hypothetical protein
VQNEANGRVPAYTWSTADEAGLPGLNAAHVDALNDPAVRKQFENLGLQMPPQDKLAPKRSSTGRPKSQNGGR